MNALKRLWPALSLIILASALLLVSDIKNRKSSSSAIRSGGKSIALMQSASTPLQDQHVQGIKDSLRAHGFLEEGDRNLHQFNSQGDFSTASAVAREMVNGNFDMLITSSTVGLQVVAKANQTVQKTHVFGAVTYPQGAGVGITGQGRGEHPPYLAGIGTFQPVARALEIVRELKPSIKRIGVVWNPGEKCSEECLKIARKVSVEMGLELLESTAANPSEVNEALRSLLAKKIEAVWVGGDTVAISSLPMMIHMAKQSGVPVFTNDPMDAAKGAVFGIGADYYTVGRYTGDMASEILDGKSPADYAITNVVPELLKINHDVVKSLGSSWSLPDSLRQAEDKELVKAVRELKPEPGRKYTVGICYFGPMPIFETAIESFRKEMAKHGFIEGRNLTLLLRHPSGEMSMLPMVTKGLVKDNPDVFVALSTPCLANAIALAKDCRIVFSIVSAPFQAGVGESFAKHLPNVTGVVEDLPTDESFELAKKFFPRVKRIGVMYNPSEANSVKELAELERIFKKLNLELVSVTAASANEAAQNINALIPKRIDMYFIMADNTVASSLPTVVKVCSAQNIPILAVDSSVMGSGAFLSCASGPGPDGRTAARLVMRVLLGEPVKDIPIVPSEERELTMDMNVLRRYNVKVPADLLMRCNRFFNTGASRGRPAVISMVTLMSNVALEDAEKGFVAGLESLGFQSGKDYVIKRFNAQGDMSQVPQMLDAAIAQKPDIVATVTTPVMVAAARRIKDVPLVFTVSSDPGKLGICDRGRPANLCGVYDDPPIDKLVAMVLRHQPGLSTVGTVYDPSQMNSMISVEKLRKVAAARKLLLLEAPVSSVSELPMVVQSLAQRGAQALIVSADNLVVTGFPAVAKSCSASGIPVYATEPELVKLGAAAAIGDDYFEWGRSSGILAGRILAGVPVSEIPMAPTGASVVVEPSVSKLPGPVYKKEPLDIRLVMFNHTTFTEDSRNGLVDGLCRAGLREGVDFKLREYNANGDIATLSGIMTSIAAEKIDLLLAVTTPVLQSAVRFIPKDIPIVFTAVGDAVAAGVCKTDSEHLANVTGVTTRSPFEAMAGLIHEMMPGLKRVGTLYTPTEINSEVYLEFLKKSLSPYNIEVLAVPVTASSEVPLASDTLCHEDIQAVCQILDNTTRPGFLQLARRASSSELPLFVFQTSQMKGGAVLSISRDFYQAGLEAAEKALKVIRGSSPALIPISNTQGEELFLNEAAAARYKLAVSPELLKKAKPYKEQK